MRTCPSDGTVLLITRRSSVEIDTCPLCRGVWLDRADHHPRPNLPPSMPPFRRRPGTSLPASTRGEGEIAADSTPENWLAELFDTPPDDRTSSPDSR